MGDQLGNYDFEMAQNNDHVVQNSTSANDYNVFEFNNETRRNGQSKNSGATRKNGGLSSDYMKPTPFPNEELLEKLSQKLHYENLYY